MKRKITTIISLILIFSLMPTCAFAADENIESFDVTIKAPYGNVFSLSNVAFGSNTIFDGETTKYKHDLAIVSAIVTSKAGSGKIESFMKDTLKLDNVSLYDYDRTGKEEYMTGYAYGTKNILRNGKECTLLLVSCSTTSRDDVYNDSLMSDLDFMNYEYNNGSPDYNSSEVPTFCEAAKLIFDGHNDSKKDIKDIVDGLKNSGKDYIVWVTGQSRGGAIGNYLSKLLVDEYGTDHVTSYLISALNVDKNAVTKNYAKYNSIFNIVHPDDMATYLPFGPEYGSGWGFARYGVDVVLHCASSASTDLDSAQNSVYLEFVKNNESDNPVYLASDKNYRFTGSEGNGAAVKSIISYLASVFTCPKDVYTKDVSFNNYHFRVFGDNYDTEYHKFYSFVVEERAKLEASEDYSVLDKTSYYKGLYNLAKGTSKYSCEMQRPLNFALKYAFGYADFDDFSDDVWEKVLANITDLSKLNRLIAVRELGTAHFVDTYLSWLVAANNTSGNDNFQTIGYNVDNNATVAIATYDENGKFTGLDTNGNSGTKLSLSASEQAQNAKVLQYDSNYTPVANAIVLGK